MLSFIFHIPLSWNKFIAYFLSKKNVIFLVTMKRIALPYEMFDKPTRLVKGGAMEGRH